MERFMIGKCRNRFWYFVLASFLLWFLLLYLYYSGLKNDDKNQVIVSSRNFVDDQTRDQSSSVNGSSNDSFSPEFNVTGSPIDNFFIGGDWDKYLNQVPENSQKKSVTEDPIRLTENEAQSINKVFVKRNEEESNGVLAAKEIGDEKPDNITIEVTKQPGIEEVAMNESGSDSDSDSESESCSGKYIYIHDLPGEFNEDLIKHCMSLDEWTNMCLFIANSGLGPKLRNPEKVLSNTGWFETNQFMLEVIFHSRMKQYKCLTNDSSLASAVFVPYYSGLDVARYLWNSSRDRRDLCSIRLVKWLRERPEWNTMWGRDHFMVAGRITWDFRRLTDGNSDWGNKLMLLPESKNMTLLTIEASPWHHNDVAIPYPTFFHPSTYNELFQWQNRMRRTKRRYLFSFAGAPRPNSTESIRSEIIDQCLATRRKCKLLECVYGSNKCYEPVYVMKLFQSSVFCLQPPGDSYTRRSTFDSILAGCIPVFFHPGSAYVQYIWHLPKNYTKYSVFIPANDIKDGNASIERILSRIPKSKVISMRNQVIKLIPGVVYTDPKSSLTTLDDAFDITIEGVLERVGNTRKAFQEGREVSDEREEFPWKKRLFGTREKHDWDIYFERL